jgi:hypothetical protein
MSILGFIFATPPEVGALYECKYSGLIVKVSRVEQGRVVYRSATLYGEYEQYSTEFSSSIRDFQFRFNKIPTLSRSPKNES